MRILFFMVWVCMSIPLILCFQWKRVLGDKVLRQVVIGVNGQGEGDSPPFLRPLGVKRRSPSLEGIWKLDDNLCSSILVGFGESPPSSHSAHVSLNLYLSRREDYEDYLLQSPLSSRRVPRYLWRFMDDKTRGSLWGTISSSPEILFPPSTVSSGSY